jgi:Phage integrase, N-terminal SAM-like domain
MAIKERLPFRWVPNYSSRDFKPSLQHFERYLKDIGLQDSTIESYIRRVNKFLEFAQNDKPTITTFNEFRIQLQEKKLSRSSINNYSFAIKCYYKMLGNDAEFYDSYFHCNTQANINDILLELNSRRPLPLPEKFNDVIEKFLNRDKRIDEEKVISYLKDLFKNDITFISAVLNYIYPEK